MVIKKSGGVIRIARNISLGIKQLNVGRTKKISDVRAFVLQYGNEVIENLMFRMKKFQKENAEQTIEIRNFLKHAVFSGPNTPIPKIDIFDGGLVYDDAKNLYLLHESAYEAALRLYQENSIPSIDFENPKLVSPNYYFATCTSSHCHIEQCSNF